MKKTNENLIVAKFGGTSMANSDTIAKVADIIKSDKVRRFVIVSAPGKRISSDTKVTDMLYAYAEDIFGIAKWDKAALAARLGSIRERFDSIVSGLKINLNIDIEIDIIVDWLISHSGADRGVIRDYLASRGEYMAGKIMAARLGYEFVDACDIIKFDAKGGFLADRTNELCTKRLSRVKGGAVIPGFYGSCESDNTLIRTFSRGGSDVSGAIVARAAGATVYENWTDVDGFMKTDPRIVDNPSLIDILTYKELRELAYMGANVLHHESIFPVRSSDIPINIRNTFNPKYKGTMIVPTKHFGQGEYVRNGTIITGIAGKKDFVAISVEKSMMGSELGFARRFLEVLERQGISLEHMPTGIDTMCVVFEKSQLKGQSTEAVVSSIKKELNPDKIKIIEDMALIAIVGHGMESTTGVSAAALTSLACSGINIRLLDQGSSELNIIVGVSNSDFESAIKALYTMSEVPVCPVSK